MRKASLKGKRWGFSVFFVLLLVGAIYLYKGEKDRKYDAEELSIEASVLPGFAGVELVLQKLPEPPVSPGSVKIPIMIYHSVRPYIPGEDAEQDAYDVTPELLESELKYLKDNSYTTISLDELELIVEGKDAGPKKPVVLTFDDGWRNQYVYAFPLLNKYKDTATFYVYTNPITHNLPHYMTWDMLKEMDKAGMTIGSHTVTHPYLSTLTPEALRGEVLDSKILIEAKIGKPVLHFASPFGYTNVMIQGVIKDAGYETARTTFKSIYHSKDDLYSMGGILVDDSLKDFVKSLGN